MTPDWLTVACVGALSLPVAAVPQESKTPEEAALHAKLEALLGEPSVEDEALDATSAAADEWSWRIAPYVWTASIDGRLDAGVGEVELDFDFADVWDDMETGGLLLLETRRDHVRLIGEVIYLEIEEDGETTGGAGVEVDADTTILELIGFYEVAPGVPFEMGAGVRYLDLEVELDGGGGSIEAEPDSFDMFAATRATWAIGEGWGLVLYGDLG